MTPEPRPRPAMFGGWLTRLSWLLGMAVLVALVVTVVTHFGEERRFALLLRHARPAWLAAAALLQVGTYFLAGGIWQRVLARGGRRLRLGPLARLAVEKLFVDKLLPTAGLSGNVVVVRALERRGVPAGASIGAVLLNLVGYWAGLTAAVVAAVVVLAVHHRLGGIVFALVGAFAVGAAAIPLLVALLTRQRRWRPPPWLRRLPAVRQLLDLADQVEPGLLRDPWLLVQSTLLELGIVALDAATLWVMFEALGVHVPPTAALAALMMGTVASMVGIVPAGLGTFEGAAIATFTVLVVPVEAALAATLLFRGYALWLPLVPGFILSRRDLFPRPVAGQEAPSSPTP